MVVDLWEDGSVHFEGEPAEILVFIHELQKDYANAQKLGYMEVNLTELFRQAKGKNNKKDNKKGDKKDAKN